MTTGKYCGTQYGYRLHRKNETKVCKRCRDAMNAVNAASRARNHKKEIERHRQYRERQITGESLEEYRSRVEREKRPRVKV